MGTDSGSGYNRGTRFRPRVRFQSSRVRSVRKLGCPSVPGSRSSEPDRCSRPRSPTPRLGPVDGSLSPTFPFLRGVAPPLRLTSVVSTFATREGNVNQGVKPVTSETLPPMR